MRSTASRRPALVDFLVRPDSPDGPRPVGREPHAGRVVSQHGDRGRVDRRRRRRQRSGRLLGRMVRRARRRAGRAVRPRRRSRRRCRRRAGEGSWYLAVRARDVAGNAGPVVRSGPYLVDTTAPRTTSQVVPLLRRQRRRAPARAQDALAGVAVTRSASGRRFVGARGPWSDAARRRRTTARVRVRGPRGQRGDDQSRCSSRSSRDTRRRARRHARRTVERTVRSALVQWSRRVDREAWRVRRR